MCFFLFGDHTQHYSGFTPDSFNGNWSCQCSGVHKGCRALNVSWPPARQMPYMPYFFIPYIFINIRTFLNRCKKILSHSNLICEKSLFLFGSILLSENVGIHFQFQKMIPKEQKGLYKLQSLKLFSCILLSPVQIHNTGVPKRTVSGYS